MNLNDIQIRPTAAGDNSAICHVQAQSFGYDKEARLTAALLEDPSASPAVSLLALHKGAPVGHILFTRARFDRRQDSPLMHILAPLAVIPAYQRQGIGGLLIRAGLEILRQQGSRLAFVLGHKDYYPRYGFLPDAARLGYPAPYPIPAEYADCWMVQSLDPRGFDAGKGRIECCDILRRPEHWRNDESDR